MSWKTINYYKNKWKKARPEEKTKIVEEFNKKTGKNATNKLFENDPSIIYNELYGDFNE